MTILPILSMTSTGLGGILSTLFLGSGSGGDGGGSAGPTRLGSKGNYDDVLPPSVRLGAKGSPTLKTNNGKIDWSDPTTQLKVAKLMEQAGQDPSKQAQMQKYMHGLQQGGLGADSTQGFGQQQWQPQKGNGNSKFNFDSPNEQVAFVKFLQSFDQSQPSQSKGTQLSLLLIYRLKERNNRGFGSFQNPFFGKSIIHMQTPSM